MISDHKRRDMRDDLSLSLCLPCEETRRNWPSRNQEEGPPSQRTGQPPELGEINVYCLSHSLYGIPLQQPEMTKMACQIIILLILTRTMVIVNLGRNRTEVKQRVQDTKQLKGVQG